MKQPPFPPAAPEILEVYPAGGVTRELNGTYLAHDLRAFGSPQQPFVYANFVTSLDGRIAVVEAETGDSYGLDDLTSGHDWRLFQELQAQADCLVTHGGYLRALAGRKFQDILQVGVTEPASDIGGEVFHTMISGPPLGRLGRPALHTLYFDEAAPKGTGCSRHST